MMSGVFIESVKFIIIVFIVYLLSCDFTCTSLCNMLVIIVVMLIYTKMEGYYNADWLEPKSTEVNSFLFLNRICVGVVSVNFEEDEEGNLCLMAYPLHSDPSDLETSETLANGEPKSKLLKWSKKKPSNLLENDRTRQNRKDDKSKM